MSDQEERSVSDIATDVLERDSEERRALAVLLDRYASVRNQLLVQKVEMGGTESYVGAVTLEWFAERVSFASQLPLFREKLDPDSRKLIVDKDTIDEILQRPIDYTRQAPLAQYLAARPRHKFPPVLVVVSQGWVDDASSDEWDSEKRAVRSATQFTPLDNSGSVGMLDVSESMQIFALDGQHRLLGVNGLMNLIKTGELKRLDKDGHEKKKTEPIRIEDLEQPPYNVLASDLQNLRKELIGIEFISAVVPGETRIEATRRVRSIFVHVNRMAAPLSKGQIHQLDEDNGFALVAKRLATRHGLLTPEGRVNWDSNTIAKKSTSFTTLQTLTEMAKAYLSHKYPHWDQEEKGLIPMRPEDDELDEGTALFDEFLDKIASLPSVKRMIQGTPSPVLRNFQHEQEDGEANVIFRPVGQQTLAGALGSLVFEYGLSVEDAFGSIKKLDQKGGFAKIDESPSMFYGILYDPNRTRMLVAGKELATRLLIYMVRRLDDPEREELRSEFASARTIEDMAFDFNGQMVDPEEISLPDPVD